MAECKPNVTTREPGSGASPRLSLRPHQKVRRPQDFRRAFGRKRAVSDARLVVHSAENGGAPTRLGISVPRKVARNAVARNRLKRIVREAFRLAAGELPQGVDLIVVPREPSLSLAEARSALPGLARDAARRLGRPRPPSPSSRP